MTLDIMKRGRYIAGVVEKNQLIKYAVDPENSGLVTFDSRKAYRFKDKAEADDWCHRHSTFSTIYAWGIGS